MKYMGCVTDMSWKLALMEQYPDTHPTSRDSFMRKKISQEKRDVPELAQASVKHEARCVYDVPKADLTHPRWAAARSHNRYWRRMTEDICR